MFCLVNQQQVTETLGEIRLRRYDIHRKLLDTALYAAILRFVGHGRGIKEIAVAPKIIGVPSPEKKWMKRRARERNQRPGKIEIRHLLVQPGEIRLLEKTKVQ